MKRKRQDNSRGEVKQDSLEKVKPSDEDEPKHVDQKRRIGRGEFKGTCYKCREVGHRYPKAGHRYSSKAKVAWYINGLRFNIKD